MKLLAILPFATTIIAESDLTHLQKDWCKYVFTRCDLGNPDSICYAPDIIDRTSANLCQPGCRDAIEEAGLNTELYDQFCPIRNANCPPGGCQSAFDMAGINGYGCWCNLGNNLTKGSGPVQNEVDEICKKFQLCLRCARWDGYDQGYSCDPITDQYMTMGNSAFGFNCSAANVGDDCGVALCSCNIYFIQRLFTFVWDTSFTYDDSLLHTNGFNTTVCTGDTSDMHSTSTALSSAVNNAVVNDIELGCCGWLPDRFPYNVLAADKACCETSNDANIPRRLYNPVTHQCCTDGHVLTLGDTCA